MTNEIIERARKIKMLILDCDGVLTDGRILITAEGDEMKSFDVKDGHAIVMWHRAGLRSGIISGVNLRWYKSGLKSWVCIIYTKWPG